MQKRTREMDFSEADYIATTGKVTIVFFSNERAGRYNTVSYYGGQAVQAAQAAYTMGLAVHQVKGRHIDRAMSPRGLTVTAVYQK